MNKNIGKFMFIFIVFDPIQSSLKTNLIEIHFELSSRKLWYLYAYMLIILLFEFNISRKLPTAIFLTK